MSPGEPINPDALPSPSGFSYAVRAEPGVSVHFAGHTAVIAEGSIVSTGDIAGQFKVALANLQVTARAAGVAPADFVSLRIYVTDITAYQLNAREIGEIYRAAFGRHYPAFTLVEVVRLWDPEAMIEIEGVAVRAAGA